MPMRQRPIESSRPARSSRAVLLPAAVLLITAGCNALTGLDGRGNHVEVYAPPTPPPSVFALYVEEGQSQMVAEGTPVPLPVRVRLLDLFQRPRAGVRLRLSVGDGGGALSDSVAVTDSNGSALLPTWRVGAADRPQRVLVRAGDSVWVVRATSVREQLGAPSGRLLLGRGNQLLEWTAGASSPVVKGSVPSDYWLAAVSPDERLVAMVNRKTPSEVCVLPTGSLLDAAPQCVNERPPLDFVHAPSEFSWSPDGQRLVFNAQWGETDVCPMDCQPAFGARVLELAPLRTRWLFELVPPVPVSVAWSPDGGQVVLLRGDTVRLMDADGTRRRDLLRVRAASTLSDLRWSPDGRRVAAIVRSEPPLQESAIVVIDVATGVLTEAARLDGYLGSPGGLAWSRDGRSLAFGWRAGEFDPSHHVLTVPANGGPVTRVARDLRFVDWR